MLVEVMAVIKKIIEEMQPPELREKVRVVHLSNRFLQLIKSQMDYFSPAFRDTLENIEQYFMHSKELSGRISITTFQTLEGLLSNHIKNKSVEVYHFGTKKTEKEVTETQHKGE